MELDQLLHCGCGSESRSGTYSPLLWSGVPYSLAGRHVLSLFYVLRLGNVFCWNDQQRCSRRRRLECKTQYATVHLVRLPVGVLRVRPGGRKAPSCFACSVFIAFQECSLLKKLLCFASKQSNLIMYHQGVCGECVRQPATLVLLGSEVHATEGPNPQLSVQLKARATAFSTPGTV
jgi:hypothetical protein